MKISNGLDLILVIIPFIFIWVLLGYMEEEHRDLIKKLKK